jgi:hypothetical protein
MKTTSLDTHDWQPFTASGNWEHCPRCGLMRPAGLKPEPEKHALLMNCREVRKAEEKAK